MHRRFSLGCFIAGLAILARAETEAHATNVGQAYDALPGLHHVPVAEPSESRLTAALSMGYGVTEARAQESSSHQRVSSIAAIGIAPLPELQIGLSATARYDRHPSDESGSDSGTVLDPRLAARWVQPVSAEFALGLELGAWFPGTEAASRTLRATTPHAALLGTLAVGSLGVSARAGYRLDRSAEAAGDLERLRAGDRLALGLSDFDAVLAGVGASYRISELLLLAEASADLLRGEGAPPLAKSPIGASAGARYAISDAWSLELLAEGCFSGRPASAVSDPLVPVQPRFAALAGVRFRLPPVGADSEATQPSEPAPAPVREPIRVHVDLSYSLPDETVVPRATLQQSGKELTATRVSAREIEFAGALPGEATLRVSAEGYQPVVQTIEIGPGEPPRVSIELLALAPSAQIRGLVRSLEGKSLRATIHVEPLGVDLQTDGSGFFELDVPAGRYDVRIEAAGYRTQRKRVVVEKDGVVILNADLLKEP